MKIVRLTAVAGFLGMLASCASLGIPSPKTPRQAVFASDGAFLGAVTIANDYKALPDCVSNGPIICKDPAVLEKIRLGASAADATLKAAEDTVKDPNFGGSTSDSAIVAATNAVAAFVSITSALKTH